MLQQESGYNMRLAVCTESSSVYNIFLVMKPEKKCGPHATEAYFLWYAMNPVSPLTMSSVNCHCGSRWFISGD